MRDRPEAGGAVGDHHADVAGPLALDADGVAGDRRRALVEEGADHLEQLVAVDRAALQLEVDVDVGRDRCRGLERGDVLRRGVDDRHEVLHVSEVPQRLDAARGRAGPDRHQPARLRPHLSDPLGVIGGGDRALDQREVVGALHLAAGRLQEVGDLDLVGQRDQLALEVEQGELAAIAGGELPDRQLGALVIHSSLTPSRVPIRPTGKTGPSLQTKRWASWQCPQWPTAHFMLRSSETWMLSSGTPRSWSAVETKRIITSGPQTIAVVRAPSNPASGISEVTSPTRPSQSPGALSTVVATLTPASRQRRSSLG